MQGYLHPGYIVLPETHVATIVPRVLVGLILLHNMTNWAACLPPACCPRRQRCN